MIKDNKQYKAISRRIEELLKIVSDRTPNSDSNLIELDLLSQWMEAYEEVHFPVTPPSLAEVMKLRMYEKELSQTTLSKKLGISSSRVSEYLSGKSEPTLKIARKISRELNIEPGIVLGL
ncbi:helix-turn-helix domain-containing protein [Niabella ginsengisoli]|uniref:Helix-turn-helix domain-containing protein n=1 Tax=Niabella ginsengisoli TaxID=522298 RepID=A0ABS9SMH4_9BACT|nr:helix-turn-helix domain-containing protein [Niabella ginsengisoli]MCH5599567.1 helix-turn-helix domain-containing protein [Niabella ginsengisoli]